MQLNLKNINRTNEKTNMKTNKNRRKDDSDIFKSQSLMSIKRRKIIKKVLMVILTASAIAVIAACFISTIFDIQ